MKFNKRLIILFFISIILITNHLEAYKRIVVLPPALTEIVFKLGEGDKIIGLGSYCNYPPETSKITKVGSFMTVNYELILSLKPDLIIDYVENIKTLNFAQNHNIKILRLKHRTLNDIYDSILEIGKILGKEKKGIEIVKAIKDKLNKIKNRVKKRRKILVIISRQPGTFKNMYILGQGDYLNTIIKLSGGDNIYNGKIAYPQVSEEIFYIYKPDIIVELIPNKKIDSKIIQKDWERFKDEKFYKNIKIIRDNYPVIPGPRIYKTAELFFKIINNAKD